jgi:hypothetical protein
LIHTRASVGMGDLYRCIDSYWIDPLEEGGEISSVRGMVMPTGVFTDKCDGRPESK